MLALAFLDYRKFQMQFCDKTFKDKHLVIPRISFLKYFSLTFVTSIERISFKSWRTRARCSVVLHRANSRWTTWFIHYTRVYAASISTCLTGSAFKIGRAANGFRLSWEIAKWDDKNGVVFLILDFRFKIYCFYIKLKEKRTYFVTVNISLSGKTRNTGTTHSSQRKRAMNRTLCIWCAWLNNFAGIFTISTETCFSTWTFFVLFTSRIRGRRN